MLIIFFLENDIKFGYTLIFFYKHNGYKHN